MVAQTDRYALAAWLRDECLTILSPRPRCVALFGSFTGGLLRPESDIDILLVGNSIPKRPYAKAEWFNPLRKSFVDTRELDPTGARSMTGKQLARSAYYLDS